MKYVENVFAKYTDEKTLQRIKCFDSINELWETSVKEFKDEVALQDKDRQWKYGELDQKVAQFRAILKENGLNKGDFVGVFVEISTNTDRLSKNYRHCDYCP